MTSAGTPRPCPPSAVADQILTWGEVQEGDLVLLDDCLVVAERVVVTQKSWADGTTFPAVGIDYRLHNGVLVTGEHHGDRYTAVRRYTEGEGKKAADAATAERARILDQLAGWKCSCGADNCSAYDARDEIASMIEGDSR